MSGLKNFTSIFIFRLVSISIFSFILSFAVWAGQSTDTTFGPKPADETQPVESAAVEQESSSVDETFMVRKIEFKGVQSLRKEMLQTLIQTQVGQEISDELLTKDIESLYKDTGFFFDIAVDVQNAEDGGFEVTFLLDESPKVEGITIIGNEELDIGKLMDRITLRRSEIYSDRLRWESERAIRSLYHEKGYYLVSIQVHDDRNEENNTTQITFEIDDGPRVRITEINFIGNDKVDAKKLRKKMKTRVGKHFDEILFEEEDLSLNLRNYYQDLGFAQVKIEGHTKRFSEDKTGLMLDITVDEGAQYVVGTYNVQLEAGEKIVFSEQKIRDMLDPAEGENFNRATFEESIQELQQIYYDKGYLLADVNPIPFFDEANALVNITLQVNQGDVIIIDDVPIRGLAKTKDFVIRRELDWLNIKSDELLDVKVLRKARQRLFQMGPFIRAVDFVPSDTDNDSRKNLVVNIAESPTTGTLSVGGGYGSEGGIFGTAEVGQHNLFGRAYRVHLKGELGTRDHHTAEARFGTPWIFSTPTRLNARIYNKRRFRRYYTVGTIQNQNYQDYLRDRYVWDTRGGSVSIGRPIAFDIDASVRFRNDSTNNVTQQDWLISLVDKPLNDVVRVVDGVEVIEEKGALTLVDESRFRGRDKESIKEQLRIKSLDKNSAKEYSNRSTRSILFAVGRDTRDYRTSLYDPMGGSSNTISYEYSGGFLGADNEFQKYSADTSWFFNPWWNHVFAVHARASYMQNKSEDNRDLFYERFYLGGVDTIRGYEDYEIYPDPDETNIPNPFGGNKMFFTNLEYRIPVSPQLTTAVFFDFGQVWDESMPNIFNQINIKRGAGVEARLQMLGMLARFGWGYGFDRQNRPPQGRFYFTIGPGF
ncbi:MAG: outer membrane protein assembly factor BamA [Candidatus Poribacteria bacterium]|nr:outer membrane protein assembly factor BamA [Candidatus Poribacteria bacterium]